TEAGDLQDLSAARRRPGPGGNRLAGELRQGGAHCLRSSAWRSVGSTPPAPFPPTRETATPASTCARPRPCRWLQAPARGGPPAGPVALPPPVAGPARRAPGAAP